MASNNVLADANPAKCSSCSKLVTKNGVLCEMCDGWFHNQCEKISKDDYDKMSALGNKSRWFCQTCSIKFKVIKSDNDKMKEEIAALKDDNKLLRDKLERIEEKLRSEERARFDKIEEKLDNIQKNLVNDIKQKIMDDMKEEVEKEKRKDNLVIYNLPEPELLTDQDGQDELDNYEKQICKELIEKEIKVPNVTIVSVKRLGNGKPKNQTRQAAQGNRPAEEAAAASQAIGGAEVDGINDVNTSNDNLTGSTAGNGRPKPRPRPLLVTLTDVKIKWTVLKNCKNLKHNTNPLFSKVSLTPDLTFRQRQADKQLREELLRRKQLGETDIYISKRQIHKIGENF